MKLVEVARKVPLLVGPDPLEACDELLGAAISLSMIEPPLPDRGELYT